MARGTNKLMKLKSILEKLISFNGRQSSSHHSSAAATVAVKNSSSANLQVVYVGKSRRWYLISSDIMDHPLFRKLAERSGQEEEDAINFSCEVVWFEHLLWVLDNADPHLESMKELITN